MKNLLQIIFLALLLLSCQKDEPVKTLDFEQFKIDVPANWQSFSRQGYDSKVGGITNGADELLYDYGWYSYDFQNETTASHTRINSTIDGKPALIVRPKEKGKGIIGVYIEVDSFTRFNLYGQNIKDEEVVLKIFESIRF